MPPRILKNPFQRLLIMFLIVVSSIALPSSVRAQDAPFTLELFASGFERPVFMTENPVQPGRFFVIEQGGHIHVLQDGEILHGVFLDLSDRVSGGNEQGLLGFALHPEFASNGYVFVDYTDLTGNTQVVRFTVMDTDSLAVDMSSETVILSVEQPARNHNSGMIAFGPDGYLYIGLGDGGNQGDPDGNGQNTATLLGSILRIDVDSPTENANYGIPADNPFVHDPNSRAEIWSYGLRNPWRFSFDREAGDLWIGDVGQSAFEEVDLAPAGAGGMNFGWNLAEGDSCYLVDDCEGYDLDWPVFSYSHDFGISVVGGYVYRGTEMPALIGDYFFADYGSGLVWIHQPASVAGTTSGAFETGVNISSFAEDLDGELYVIGLDGSIYRIVAT